MNDSPDVIIAKQTEYHALQAEYQRLDDSITTIDTALSVRKQKIDLTTQHMRILEKTIVSTFLEFYARMDHRQFQKATTDKLKENLEFALRETCSRNVSIPSRRLTPPSERSDYDRATQEGPMPFMLESMAGNAADTQGHASFGNFTIPAAAYHNIYGGLPVGPGFGPEQVGGGQSQGGGEENAGDGGSPMHEDSGDGQDGQAGAGGEGYDDE